MLRTARCEPKQLGVSPQLRQAQAPLRCRHQQSTLAAPDATRRPAARSSNSAASTLHAQASSSWPCFVSVSVCAPPRTTTAARPARAAVAVRFASLRVQRRLFPQPRYRRPGRRCCRHRAMRNLQKTKRSKAQRCVRATQQVSRTIALLYRRRRACLRLRRSLPCQSNCSSRAFHRCALGVRRATVTLS